MSVLSLGVVDYDPLVLYALRDLVQRSSERIRLLWSVRSRRAALRHLAADEPTPDVILVDTVSDRSEESAPLEEKASQAGAAVVAMSASGALDRQAPRPEGMHEPCAVVPKEAIDLYAQGMTTQSVAHRMSVSETTVKTYARRAYKKLGVGSRAEAVAVLARRGVI